MKSKRLLLMLLMAFALPWAALAQETLTVHAGTETSRFVPIYGYYADDAQTNQMIYPATELADMAGGEISAMMLYWTNGGYSGGSGVGTWTISIGETSATTLSGLDNTTSLTQVFTGGLDALFNSNNTLPITFDNAYTYNGGNLLVQFSHSASSYKDYAFYGETVTGASYCYNSQRNFLPKTTFTYTPTNYCGKPANVHIVENTLGPREVAIEWDAESGELFQISMQATSSFDPNDINWSDATTSHYEEWDLLEPGTDYTFCVRKKCGTDSYSQPVFLEFRTTVPCPAPTLTLVANSETARGATLNWTGFSDSYILQMGSFVSSQTVTVLSQGFEGGSMPTGWTSEGTSWTVGTGDYSSSTTHTGSYNAKPSSSSSGSGYTGYLVTPVMNLNSYSNAKLSCWYMNHSWGGDTDAFGVYYRTSSTGTWNELFSTNIAHTSWTQTDELTLPSEAYVQIGFKYTDNYGYGVAVDDIEITADVVEYEWITHDNNATSPYTFTTLLPETTYNVRVIGNCGSDGQSQPSNMVSFTTLASCPVPTALNVPETTITAHEATLLWTADNDSYNIRYIVDNSITEGFEGGTLPNGWTVTSTGSNNWAVASSVISGVAPHGGSYAIGTPSGTSSRSEEMYLISPSMDLSTATSATLHFYYYQRAWGNDIDPFGVYYRVNGGSWQQLFYSTEATSEWTEKTIELQGLAANYQIGFYRKDNYAYGNAIDDIQISIEDPTATWQTATSNTTTYNFTGLNPENTYIAQVQGVCGGEPTDWSETVSFTTLIACPAPTNLVYDNVTKNSVELSWTETGGATEWEICINGDEENLVGVMENPYTLDRLDPQTDYTVKVRAVCGGEDGESAWSNTISFTTVVACPAPTNLVASNATYNSVELSWTESGEATEWELCVNGDTENLIGVTENPYTLNRLDPDTDYTVKVRANCGGDDGQSQWSNTVSFTTPEACAKPTNLAETNITTNSATLSWNGTSEQYVLQYRPWQQVGEDHLSTEEFVTYTYDLSEFKGQGSIAIRHYDVTDVFYLNVDNVELKAADETTIFFEDFESGSIPSTWTNYDVDGDGYTWDMAQTGSMNVIGNYGVYSASWLSGVGALTPDNWLIISNVELGGTFSFAARGQDPNYPNENFAVYVSMESDITEVAVNGTSYNAENLTPATPYAWQVKSDCGEYQSNWVTSLFKTKDDAYIFATDGDWDDLANWTDAEGNPISELPTVERKVRVNAEAIIPAGVVATSGKTTITDDGSITIKDGGELKHNTATLWVTMEKDITAWTIGETIDENNKSNGWYFISTPFSGTTEIEASGAWSHVNNLAADGYDLYGFDPTADQEWINYEADSLHAVFTAGNNHGLVFKRGYLYASDTDRTVTFTGTISKSVNNSMTETFDYDGTSTDRFNGWALVGNPFSCSAYINYVDGEDVLEADFYVMNADGNGYELSQSSVALAPLTGAFINYSATGTVQFSTENNRAAQSGLLNMTVSQGRGNVDMARVRFGRGHNLKHMSFRNNSSKLYIPQDNDYAVVYTEDNVGEMPVSFKAEKNGTYSLSFTSQEVSFSYLHLIDNMTGNDVNLLETPSYTFNASTTDYANRFRLVFATGSTVDGENFGFVNAAGNLCIFGIEGEATVQVVDMLGHVLSSEQFSGSYEKSLNAAPGVYMIRLIQGNDMKVQKIVVK